MFGLNSASQRGWILASLLVLSLIPSCPGLAANEYQKQQAALREARIDPKLGAEIPLELEFKDSHGKTVRLADYFNGKPVLLTPVYYSCPMLCSLVLNGLVKALRVLSFTPGQEFEIVTFSINPEETTELAAVKRENYLKDYGRPEASSGWHFLTGREADIKRLTDAIGFHYYYDEKSGEYAHAASLVLVTPEGRISHYFYGIEIAPRDLRLGLVEAAAERIGNFVDQVFLLCYHYDPATGKYGFAIMNALRVAGVLTVLALALFIGGSLRSEKREKVG